MAKEIQIVINADGRQAVRRIRATEDELDDLRGAGGRAGRDLAGAFRRSADSADDLGDAADGAGRRFDSMGERAKAAGRALRNGDYEGAAAAIGKLRLAAIGAGVAVGAVGAAAYGFSAYQAVQFESAMTEVAKTTGLAGEELEALGEGVQGLAGQLGLGQEELAGIAATAGQLGIQGRENLLNFTETVAKLSAVSELSSEEASTQIARIANAFNVPITEAKNLGSVLNELSNTTTAKAGDISKALTKVGSAGASIGLTADQVAGLGATLIDTGIVAERAGTSLRNVFVRLETQGAKLADVAGMTQEEFSSLVQDDALAALQAYLGGLGDMEPTLRAIKIKEVFGDENYQAVKTLSEQTDLLNKNMTTSREAMEEGTSLNKEFSRTLETVSKQWQKLKGNLLAVATSIGSTALPALQDLLKSINGLFDPVGTLRQEFSRLRGEFEAITKKQQLLDRYNQLVSDGEQGTDEFQRIVSELSDDLPDYAVKWNEAGEAVGVYANQVRTLISVQREQTRLEMIDNLREQADQFENKLRTLRGAQNEYVQSLRDMQQQVDIGTLEDIQRYLEAGVDPDNIIFAGYRQLVKDLEEGKSTIQETKPAVQELANSFAVWYDITSTPGTQAYQQDLRRLSAELGITQEAAADLIDQMQLVGEGPDAKGTAGGGGLKKQVGALSSGAESAKTALQKAREALDTYEAKLEDLQDANLTNLQALHRHTQAVREQIDAYEEWVRIVGEGLGPVESGVELAPDQDELMQSIQSLVPDTVPTDEMERIAEQAGETSEAMGDLAGESDDTGDAMMDTARIAATIGRAAFQGLGDAIKNADSAAEGLKMTLSEVLSSVGSVLTQLGIKSGNPFLIGGGLGLNLVGGLFADGGPVHADTGGRLRGPGGPRADEIPVMASDGEWIINAESAGAAPRTMQLINSGAGAAGQVEELLHAGGSSLAGIAGIGARAMAREARSGTGGAQMQDLSREIADLRASVEAMREGADTFTTREPRARVSVRDVQRGLGQQQRDDRATGFDGSL